MQCKNELASQEQHNAIMDAMPIVAMRDGRMFCDLYISDPSLKERSDVAVYSLPMLEAIQNAILFNDPFDLDEDQEAEGSTAAMIKDLKLMIATLEAELFPR